MWNTLIIQPIFNLLVYIWGVFPVQDFGVALIIFTIITRILMWPLVKKQIQQSKGLRAIQPELQKIRKKYKDDRQQLAQAQMALYQSKGINPFGSIFILFVQLPLFFGVFSVVRQLADNPEVIAEKSYGFVSSVDKVQEVIQNPALFEKAFFGIDLTRSGFGGDAGLYVPLILIAAFAAVMQFVTARMLMPTNSNARSLREILKAEANGQQAEQSEIMAASTGMMRYFLPAIVFFFASSTTGAIALYLAASATIAYVQQKIIASQKSTDADGGDLTVKTYTASSKKRSESASKKKASQAVEAEIVSTKPKKKSAAKKKPTKSGKKSSTKEGSEK